MLRKKAPLGPFLLAKYFMRTFIATVLILIVLPIWAKQPVPSQTAPITDVSDLTAQSWLVADGENQILVGKDTAAVRSIGSITKLMTALAVMELRPQMDQRFYYGGRKFLFSREELIEIMLVRSDNAAADILCKNYPGGYQACIAAMNRLAQKFNMTNTQFADASGLSPGNVSTAEDLLKLLNVAERNYMVALSASKTKIEIRNKKKWLIFKNTNPLIGRRHHFIVSKTGTTNAAGGCIVLTVETERGLRRVVVLGSRNGRTRIPEAEFIYKTN
jgi:D-alanyl-D-alanine endopeptidase (penicillin-binding protein 7)